MELIVKPFDRLTAAEVYELLKARAQVFLLEQQIVCQDMDDVDYRAWHVFFRDGEGIKAYLRAYEKDAETAQIGRVLTTVRGKGYGADVMRAGIETARDIMGKTVLRIEAQTHAIGFYEKLGFAVTSEEFLDVGIPHVEMKMNLL